MGIRIFGCRGCEARENEISRQQRVIEWLQGQVDVQNKRFLEITDPRANERVVQADRLDRKPVTTSRKPSEPRPLLPGTEPSPSTDSWEVADES
jgi:hypothetical protein